MRPATPDDARIIAHHRYFDDRDAAERSVYAAWVAPAIRDGTYLGFLAEGAGQVVAWAGVTLLHWGPSRGDPQPFRARVVNVWTHPEHRRRGHARTLVTAALHAAREQGITRFSVGSTDSAWGLYVDLGFRAAPTELSLTAVHLPAAGHA